MAIILRGGEFFRLPVCHSISASPVVSLNAWLVQVEGFLSFSVYLAL